MSEKLPKTLTVERCRCPWPNCSTYQFKEGFFYQGSGFSKEAAEEIAHRYNVHEELVDALKHLMRYDFGDSEGAKKARAAIAAAPEMYEALKVALEDINSTIETDVLANLVASPDDHGLAATHRIIWQAIAQAEGRSDRLR